MKMCPFCTAEIPDMALKCKHCGEWVDERKQSTSSNTPDVNVTVQPPTSGPKDPCPACKALISRGAILCMHCRSSVFSKRTKKILFTILGTVLLVKGAIFFCVFVPTCMKIKSTHDAFDEDFKKSRQRFGNNEDFRSLLPPDR